MELAAADIRELYFAIAPQYRTRATWFRVECEIPEPTSWPRWIWSKVWPLLFVLLALLLTGCAFTVNGSGLHAVLGGSYYGHADENREKGTAENQETAKGKSRSNTYVARTWGTAELKGKISASEETISIKGEGISETMGKTLGKDIVREAVGAALRATPTGAALAAGKALLVDEAPDLEDVIDLEAFPVDVPVQPLDLLGADAIELERLEPLP